MFKKIIIVIKKKMSFLKIKDPAKRDAMVKEYLELKKNIRGNLLSERTGELELQTDLSKFYRPITETQKATAREITEGLKPITETQKATAREITEGLRPIREGIEKLPQVIQPLGEASKQEEELGESHTTLGKEAYKYLHEVDIYPRDISFGIYLGKDGYYHMGRQRDGTENTKKLFIGYDNIIVDGEKFKGTPGLWELIMQIEPDPKKFTEQDMDEYKKLLIKTNVMHENFEPSKPSPRGSKSYKWKYILGPIWDEYIGRRKGEFRGKGVVVIPSDPNALLERLDLLLASQDAGHTGVGNELVSICDELKRQGVLDMKTYKKINSIIKK